MFDSNKGSLLDDSNVYTSILNAPLDKSIVPDGDDSVHQNKSVILNERHLSGISTSAQIFSTNRIVVFPRETKLEDSGPDILALKRALSRAKFRKWDISTSKFGSTLEKNLKNFQHAHNLPSTGKYNLATHIKLKSYYDLYGAWLMLKEQKDLNPRNLIVSAAIFGYNHRDQINYTQGAQRMYGVRNRLYPPQVPFWEDCSSYATWTYFVAKVTDPNGFGYNGLGYTGTLSMHGSVTHAPKAGDLNFYGWKWPFTHVTICVGGTRCISHGSNYGPLLEEIRYRGDYYYSRTYLP